MAVVKILKKFKKNFPEAKVTPAYKILNRQTWYKDPKLGKLIAKCDKLDESAHPEAHHASHAWVLCPNGPTEVEYLLSSPVSMGQEKEPPRDVGVCSDHEQKAGGKNKTVILALWGCRVDALLVAKAPNTEEFVKMAPVGNSSADQPNDRLMKTMRGLWTDDTQPTDAANPPAAGQNATFGGRESDDVATVTTVAEYISGGGSADVVVMHLNRMQTKKNTIENVEYQEAIESMDELLGQLVAALKQSEHKWNTFLCMDSTATETSKNSSALVQMTPPSLQDGDDDMDDMDLGQSLTWPWTIVYILVAIGSLYGFLFGLGLMGNSFKVLGGKTAGDLFSMVGNPIAGLMVGILATVLVQSSSTSTSVVVGMCGADIIEVEEAIFIIMGANIGTSVTNTIVAMGQMGVKEQYRLAFSGATVHDCFNILCVLVMLPIEWATEFLYYFTKELTAGIDGSEGSTFKSPIKIIVDPLVKLFLNVDKKKINKIAENKLDSDDAGSLIKGGWAKDWGSDEVGSGICLALSLICLCICLLLIVHVLQKLCMGTARRWLRKALMFTETWWGGYIAIAIGCGVTIMVQSSSITTSTLTPLVGVGVITLEQMLPLTLGANIGTTITGLLAAMVSAKKNSLQVALAHLSFNIFGVLLWYPYWRLREIPLKMARFLGELAYLYRWFPLAYIFIAFVIVPGIGLGISELFQWNTIGQVFGAVICAILLFGILGFVYWYMFRGGKFFCTKLLGGKVGDESDSDYDSDEDDAVDQDGVVLKVQEDPNGPQNKYI